jgi:N-acyl-D-amino-acid deacylase
VTLPAQRFGLEGRGIIAADAYADLVLFDPAAVRDTATYDDPKQEPVGIGLVAVNGAVAYEQGRHTYSETGRLLYFNEG